MKYRKTILSFLVGFLFTLIGYSQMKYIHSSNNTLTMTLNSNVFEVGIFEAEDLNGPWKNVWNISERCPGPMTYFTEINPNAPRKYYKFLLYDDGIVPTTSGVRAFKYDNFNLVTWTLKFNCDDFVEKYLVYRSDNYGPTNLIQTTTSGQTYIHDGVTNVGNYRYFIRCQSGTNVSYWSRDFGEVNMK